MTDSTAASLDAAIAIAGEAGEVLLAHVGRDLDVHHKGAIDLVTSADRAAETLIVERLGAAFPDDAILAEESRGAIHPGGRRWLVDPLDGTTNFAHGYPLFAVSIALEIDGVVQCGVVHEPNRRETFAAARGRGATRNGRPLAVSTVDSLGRSLLVTGFPYSIREEPEPTLTLLRAFLGEAQGLRRDGSAALDLCFVAAGHFDGFWELGLKPWDVAAGSLIVEEAGGRVTNLDGGPFELAGGRLLATNGRVHQAMLGVAAAALRGRAET